VRRTREQVEADIAERVQLAKVTEEQHLYVLERIAVMENEKTQKDAMARAGIRQKPVLPASKPASVTRSNEKKVSTKLKTTKQLLTYSAEACVRL
jgi:hypothetical protein